MSITLPTACACGAPVTVVATEVVGGRLYVHAACAAHPFDGPVDNPARLADPADSSAHLTRV